MLARLITLAQLWILSCKGADLVDLLERIGAEHGFPSSIRGDKGPSS